MWMCVGTQQFDQVSKQVSGHKARTCLINSVFVCAHMCVCVCMLFDIWRELRVTLLCSLSFWRKKNILAHPGISVFSCEAKKDKHIAEWRAVKWDWALASADLLIWMLQSFTITTLYLKIWWKEYGFGNFISFIPLKPHSHHIECQHVYFVSYMEAIYTM